MAAGGDHICKLLPIIHLFKKLMLCIAHRFWCSDQMLSPVSFADVNSLGGGSASTTQDNLTRRGARASGASANEEWNKKLPGVNISFKIQLIMP